MNPRLVKFTVELQSGEVQEKEQKITKFFDNRFGNFFDNKKLAKVTIPINKD